MYYAIFSKTYWRRLTFSTGANVFGQKKMGELESNPGRGK
jgi:hypothetical protein